MKIQAQSVCFFLGILLLSPCAWAQQSCGPEFQEFRSLLKCIEQNSPRILEAQASKHQAQALPAQARQWMNPTFNLNTLYSIPNNPDGHQVQGSLQFPLDLSRIRESREKKAWLEQKELTLHASLESQSVLTQSYLDLHRIRELTQQIQLLEDTQKTLKNLLQTFEHRPRLSADQETTRESLTLALEENKNRLELEKLEQHSLVHHIEMEINASWSGSLGSLPPAPSRWPRLPTELKTDQSLPLQRVKAHAEKQEQALAVLQAEKNPIPLVGPYLGYSTLPGAMGFQVGVVLTMPLPVVESYAGSLELASRTSARAQLMEAMEKRRQHGEIEHSKEVYTQTVARLTQMQSQALVSQRIERLGQLFSQGLISGLGFLEAMRQNLLLVQSHDELEIKALESWCQIQVLQNQIEDCFL
ncbi:MAG: TolC family protein [Bdellovibrionia bacterium]